MVAIAFADIAKLLASLDLDTRPFERNARRVGTGLDRMEGGMGRVSTRAIALGSAVGIGLERLAEKGISVLFDQIRQGEDQLRTLQDAQAQTNAVIESTGGAAGVSAQQVRALAESIESVTTADDKAVQQGENLLLTFTGIGKDVFPQATKAMVDLGIALNKGNAETADFDGAAIQLGKALNDPIRGLTALRRVGVSFSKDQEKQIRQFVKAGEVQKAQGVILAELEKEFGKAGEAAGKSGAAGIRRLNDAVEEAQLALAEGLAPALEDIRAEIAAGLSDPGTQQDIRNLGKFLGQAAKSGLAFAKSVPWGQIADGLKTAAGFAGGLFKTFANLPPGVQATIIALVGLNKLAGGGVIKIGVDLFKEGAQGLFKGLFQRGGSPATPMFTKEVGVGGAGAGGAAGGLGLVGTLGLLSVTTLAVHDFPVLTDAFSRLKGVLESNAPTNERVNETIDAQRDLISGLAVIPGPLKDLGLAINDLQQDLVDKLFPTKLGPGSIAPNQRDNPKLDALNDTLKKNLQPLPDNITKKQKAQFDALRDKMEGNRIATASNAQKLAEAKAATDRVRDRIEANRIAVQSSADRLGDRIVSAIHGIRSTPVNVTLAVRGGGAAVASAFFLNRKTVPE